MVKGLAKMNIEHLNAVGEISEILYRFNNPEEEE